MEASVGNIVYTLDVNTSKFVAGMDKSEKRLEKTGQAMEKTDQKAQQLGGGLNRLANAIQGMYILDKLRDMQKLSEEFTVLSARITRLSGDAAAGAENYRTLMDVAGRSGADLGTTVKVWESLTTSLTEFGHSNESITQVTESLMKMGAIGGSTADEMKNGLRQLGQSFSGGIVRAEEFNSVLENIPEVARQIAKGMGIPFSELRKKMLDGQLTSEVVLEALKKQAKEVDAEFAKMPRTVDQASNSLRNEFGSALSALDKSSNFSVNLAKGIDMLAGSFKALAGDAKSVEAVLDGLEIAGTSLAAVLAGRLLTALYSATAAKVSMARAAISSAAADKAAAAEAVATATADFAAARAAQARAAAHLAATSTVVQGTAARAAAVEALAAADARATLAERALQGAMAQSAAVANTTSIAMRALGGAMALLGGPLGVVLLAATALYQFSTSSKEAADNTGLLTQKVDELGDAQLRLARTNLKQAIADQEDLAKGGWLTQMRVQALQERLATTPEGSKTWLEHRKALDEIQAGSEGARQEIDRLQTKLKEVEDEQGKRSAGPQAAPKPKEHKTSEEDLKQMDIMRQRLELASKEGEERARLAAVQKLSATATDAEKKAVGDMAVEVYRLENAKKDAAKADKAAASEKEKADKASKKHAEENSQAIIDYAIEIAKLTDKTADYSEAAALAKLNKFATPEDVRIMKELAAAKKQVIENEENKELVKRLDPIVGQQSAHDKELADLKRLNDAKLIEDARYQELKTAAEKANAEAMAQLEVERFRSQSVNNEALMASIEAVGQASTNVLSGLLSGTMSLQEATGNLANTVLNALIGSYVQAGVDFVKQEVVKRMAVQATQAAQQTGITSVAATQAGATAAIATTTTTTAATTGAEVATSMAPAAGLSSIASFGSAAVIGGAALLGTMLLAKSFGGGRQYGGSMSADSFYRINETGPEIFTDKTGKQYMTGANGHMTSNRDAFGGGQSRPLQVIIENYGSDQVTASQEQLTDRDVVRIVVENMSEGGSIARMTNQITGTKRPGG